MSFIIEQDTEWKIDSTTDWFRITLIEVMESNDFDLHFKLNDKKIGIHGHTPFEITITKD
ncbi:hypothetical protein LCGC14_0606310 [marine sediment metagenome]|uniref:Uncharacterized protein n=1 Tax=marine sediment metagenome TaxID=412755 RepID=A0A0F9RT44_9ZZZZ